MMVVSNVGTKRLEKFAFPFYQFDNIVIIFDKLFQNIVFNIQ